VRPQLDVVVVSSHSEAVWVWILASAYLCIGSLRVNRIGDGGARDLGAALQVNTTLRTLE
jgi:hypothetical protein